jgi:hypothetical protein
MFFFVSNFCNLFFQLVRFVQIANSIYFLFVDSEMKIWKDGACGE